MRTSRIYHQGSLSHNQEFELESQAAIHLARVLRCKEGDELILFNGDGNEYSATINRIHRNHVWVKVLSEQPVNRESPLNITLLQAISKGERMDYTIQKAVELGISNIIPLITERSLSLKADRATKKLQHWKGVITSACEQCGRNIIPDILEPVTLTDWLMNCDKNALNLILAPTASTSLNEIDYSEKNITLLIGPEGGLTDNEISQCLHHGLSGVKMGPRILRTETAAITALSIIQSRWGDLN